MKKIIISRSCCLALATALIALVVASCAGSRQIERPLPEQEIMAQLADERFSEAYERLLELNAEDNAIRQNARTVFLARKRATDLTDLGMGFFGDDRTNSLSVLFMHNDVEGRGRITQFVFGPEGEVAFNSSYLTDGALVRSAYIIDRRGNFRETLETFREIACIEEAAENGDLSALLQCLGLATSDSEESSDFEVWVQSFRNPDCSNQPGILQPSPPKPPEPDLRTVVRDADNADRYAEWAEGLNDPVLVERATALAVAARNVLNAMAAFRNGRISQETYHDVIGRYYNARESFKKAMHNNPNARNPALFEPTPDGEEVRHDSRCQGRENDVARGTLFVNPDYCTDRDYLACLAQQEDSIRRITDGKCVTGESPAGGRTLICNGPTDEEGIGPIEDSDESFDGAR